MRISSSHTFLRVCLWYRLLDMAAGKNGKDVEMEVASSSRAGFRKSLP